MLSPDKSIGDNDWPFENSDANEKVHEELMRERRRSNALAAELKSARESLVSNAMLAEAEEEYIINKLTKKFGELASDRARLALETEREEGYISNAFKKQLDQLRKDKVDIESQMEQEQECMVNKLTREVSALGKDNSELVACLAEETSQNQCFLSECIDELRIGLNVGEQNEDMEAQFDDQLAKKYFDALNSMLAKIRLKR